MANESTRALQQLSDVFKALGHPTRLWIVRKLEQGECCVQDLVTGTDEEFSTISQHLNVLKHSGVVECERRGKQIFYRLHYPCLPWLIHCMEARNACTTLNSEEIRTTLRTQLEHLLRSI